MILPDTPVVELLDLERVTIPAVLGVGEREAENYKKLIIENFKHNICTSKQWI